MIIVIDNFVKDRVLLDKIQNDSNFFNDKVNITGGMVGGIVRQTQLKKNL